jgi:uncharacterized protein YlzI (FlbEa/FlbD family)
MISSGRFSAALFFVLIACADDPWHEDPALEQLAVNLIELTGLDDEPIAINPAEIVALRSPRRGDHLMTPDAACAVQTVDGKHIAVRETCPEVRKRIDAAE